MSTLSITTPTVVQIVIPDTGTANRFIEAFNRIATIGENPPTSSVPELIPAQQYRQRTNICKATERRYVRLGLIKPLYIGRKVFYRWDEEVARLSSKSDELLPPKARRQKASSPKQKSLSK